jgi:trk system potassium uptake protein TrkA
MKVIVAGAGDLGTYLIEKLTGLKHAVSVIDNDRESLERLALRYDVATFKGNVLAFDNLEAIGCREADLFVAVTSSEELNLLSAILAKRMGAGRSVARIRHSKLMLHDDVFDFRGLGIDEIISPDALVSDEIERLLERQAFSDLVELEQGRFYIAGLQAGEGDEVSGKTMDTIMPSNPDYFVPVGLLRNDVTHLVAEKTKIKTGDRLYFIARQRGLGKLAQLGATPYNNSRRVMILGGSRVGIETARRLSHNGYKVTLIERSKDFAEDLAEFLPDVLIVRGDSREPGLMEEHDIEGMQALIAATGDPGHNMLACLTAKKHGVPYTVALVKDAEYFQTALSFGVDTLINKKLIAADFIIRHVKNNVLSVASVPGLAMEISESVVGESSPLIGHSPFTLPPVQETKIVIGGILRENRPLHLTDSIILQARDKVITACHYDSLEYLQKLF